MVTLLAPVQAPPAAPPRVGLIASAILPTDSERWQNGFSYQSESCIDGGRVDPCTSSSKTISSMINNPEWEPYGVWAGLKCSALTNTRDWEPKARRVLQAIEHFQIEQEFWTGDTATAAGFPNRFLASPASDVLSGATPLDFTEALACLEQYLAQTNNGQRGMIHATRQIVTHWAALNLVRREGNLLTTVNDTIVVPGSGYDGSDQNGNAATSGNVWAYATGMVEVRRDTIDVYGGPNAEGVDRETNTMEIRAERLAVASWDGCAHGAVAIDADLCTFGGAGS